MIENGTLLQERYLIERQIGTGGMGAVYLAVDKRFDNHVAIKETFYKEDEFGDAFEREARLLNALQHPVLPHVTDYFSEADGYFLVMQYIEGEDLSDILKREGAFPVEDVLRWTEALLDALDYLHSQEMPVIHRDIKPHNLKLTSRGGIMLLDFGLAKLNQKDVTDVSVFGYSRTYSPLEQIQGTGTDARSDIFALGATVYHLLTGSPPVNALTRASAIVNGDGDPLKLANELRPEISEAVASVINSALALNPQHRFISAKAMGQAFEYATNKTPISVVDTAAAAAAAAAPVIVPVTAAQVFETTENESFPALEVFAEAKNSIREEPPPTIEEVPSVYEEKAPAAKLNPSPLIVDVPPKFSPERKINQNHLFLAAAAVLLFFILIGAFYFGSRGNSGEQQPVENPAVESVKTEESNSETRETISEQSENDVKLKDKSAAADEISEKSPEPESEEKASDNQKPENAEAPTNPVRETVRADDTQPKKRAAENEKIVPEEELPAEDASQIETVFSGRENRRNERRQRRNEREIPDIMTEEEFEKIKREERRRRRQRRDRPIPY